MDKSKLNGGSIGGVQRTVIAAINDLGRRYGATRIALYGSRARGDYRPHSDVDIAVYGMSREDF